VGGVGDDYSGLRSGQEKRRELPIGEEGSDTTSLKKSRKEKSEEIAPRILKRSADEPTEIMPEKKHFKKMSGSLHGSPLEEAVKNGDEEEVTKLLGKEQEVPTAAMVKTAIFDRCTKIASQLILKSKGFFAVKEWKMLLRDACRMQDLKVIQNLAEKSPEKIATKIDIQEEFHSTITDGSVATAESLIKLFRPDLNQPDAQGKRALDLALEYGRLNSAKLLIDSGATYSFKDLSDFFLKAVQQNDHELGKELLQIFLTRHSESLASLEKLSEMIPYMLRYSVLISNEATVALIKICDADLLKSEQCRDFLFGCRVRQDPLVIQALREKGIDIDQLLRTRLAVQLAAEKGKAMQGAMGLLEKISAQKEAISATVSSSVQKVLLMEKEGLVLKKAMKRADEDETLISHLFNLNKAMVEVPSVRMKDFRCDRFGLPPTYRQWSFRLQELDPSRVHQVASRLTGDKEEFVEVMIKGHATMMAQSPGRDEFEECRGLSWQIEAGNSWQVASFEQLLDMVLQEKISPHTMVKIPNIAPIELSGWLQEPSFMLAMQYYLKRPKYLLVPQFAGIEPSDYEEVARTRWKMSVNQPDGKILQQELTFKELQKLSLEGALAENATFVPLGIDSDVTVERLNKLVKEALKVVFALRASHEQKETISGVELKDIKAKPFAEGMKTISSLNISIVKKMLQRLDQNSEMNALLTLELQFYDLHDRNLGIRPKLDDKNAAFTSCNFQVKGSPAPCSFAHLLEDYLKGRVDGSTTVTFSLAGIAKTGRIDSFSDLYQALEKTRYELVIFDSDICLAETNGMHIGYFSNKGGHFIPLRNCLLKMKMKALSPEVVQQLMHSEERDNQTLEWLKSSTAPIYKFMKQDDKRKIMNLIWSFANQPMYSLSAHNNRMRDPKITIADIRENFSKHLASLNRADKRAFWNSVQQALQRGGWYRPYTTRESDTSETVANNCHLTVQELRELNPHLAEPFVIGTQLRTKPDLTASTPLAVRLREKIASQLFPKATTYQIEAYKERLERRTTYLQSFQALRALNPTACTSSEQVQECLSQFRAIIDQKTTPIANINRIAYWHVELSNVEKAVDLSEKITKLQKLVDELLVDIEPSFRNLASSMYPLLEDAFVILNDLAENYDAIGLYTRPMEEWESEIKTKIANLERISSPTEDEIKKCKDLKQDLQLFQEALREELERSKIKDANGRAVFEAAW